MNEAYDRDAEQTSMDLIEETEQKLYDLVTTGDHSGGFSPLQQILVDSVVVAETAHKRDGGLSGTTTGLKDVDELLGGLHPSDLVILAGRPGMGKTALAVNIGMAAARKHAETDGEEGAVVGFFSLEMSEEQLGLRIISDDAEISSDTMRKGLVKEGDFARIPLAAQSMHKYPFFVDDTAGINMSAMRTRARRLKRQHGLGLIIVDYLQLIEGFTRSRNDGRVQEVSEITRGLKILAKELNVPVLALSQLSRQVENRDDKRPQLADLRESGSIEQDADVVVFIYRDEYYVGRAEPKRRADEDDVKFSMRQDNWEERMEKCKDLADFIVAKQRHGPVGTVHMHFAGEFGRFSDLDNRC